MTACIILVLLAISAWCMWRGVKAALGADEPLPWDGVCPHGVVRCRRCDGEPF